MEVKAKLKQIYKRSPGGIKGLIAVDALNWANPDEFFYRIKKDSYKQQPYIFRYQSFKFLSDHRETFSKELSKYNNNIVPNDPEAVWNSFSKAVAEIEREVGSEF